MRQIGDVQNGNCYDDQNVLNIAYALESVMEYKNMTAKEVK